MAVLHRVYSETINGDPEITTEAFRFEGGGDGHVVLHFQSDDGDHLRVRLPDGDARTLARCLTMASDAAATGLPRGDR